MGKKKAAVSACDVLSAIKENTLAENGGTLESGKVKAIPFPWFCLRYLLRANGWPLGKMVMVVGPPASYKSAFAIEVARWFGRQNGATFLVDTESNPYLWVESTMRDVANSIVQESVPSLDTAYTEITKSIKALKKSYESGMTDPFLLIVDSATGALDDRTKDKIDKDGAPKMGVSPQARYWSDFSRKVIADIAAYPITFLLTNHLNISKDMMTGMIEKAIPGGKRMRFMSFWMLEMRSSGRPTQYADRIESLIHMRVIKSKCGPEEVCIEVPWARYDFYGPKSGKNYSLTHFDWFKADAMLLCDGKGLPTAAKDKFLSAARDILTVRKVSGGSRGTLYYCNELDVPRSEAVPPHDLGRLLSQNKEIRKALDARFGVCEFDLVYPEDTEDPYESFVEEIRQAEATEGVSEGEEGSEAGEGESGN